MGPWSVLGNRALASKEYTPDFDAVALPPCRMLRIHRAAYRAALEATTLDPVMGYQVQHAGHVWVAGCYHPDAIRPETGKLQVRCQ
jgi:hypothetical protein